MDTRKDIGTLIEDALNMAQKSPSDALWTRVDASLEKKRKRRKFLFLWFGFGGIALLTGIALSWPSVEITENNAPKTTSDTNVKELRSEDALDVYDISEDDPTSESKQDNASIDVFISEEDNSKSEQHSEEKNNSQYTNQIPKQNSLKSRSTTNVKATEIENSFDSASAVKQTYYYYDGEKDIQIELTDKHKIDSIIRLKNDLNKVVNKTISDSISQNNEN